MTENEAIKWLQSIEKKYIHGGDESFDNSRKVAISMAISAFTRIYQLEAEVKRLDKTRQLQGERFATYKINNKANFDIDSYESPITLIMEQVNEQQIQQIEDSVLQVVQKVGVNVDKDELVKALQYDRKQYSEGYKVGYNSGTSVFIEALDNICWYNSHGPWLMNLAQRIESSTKDFFCPTDIEWDTEEHFFWMIMVGLYGDWGTSVRSGWIERKEDCVYFIKQICQTYLEVEEEKRCFTERKLKD